MTVDQRPPGIGTAFRNFDYETEIARLKRSGGGGGGGAGPAGPPGPTGYDTAPIGAVISTTRSTWGDEYVLANGQSLTEAVYPDCAVVAATEVAAGNPFWTISGVAPNRTFTVPDLRDRFLYGAGAKTRGIKSQTNPALANPGEESHLMLTTEAGQKAVTTGDDTPDHTHALSPGVVASPGQVGQAGTQYIVGGSTLATTQGASVRHKHPIAGENAATAHNNMPPYAVLVFIVKVKGVATSASVITGPTGPPGAASTVPGPAGATGPTGAAGAGVPVGGTTGQALVKKTATDYDTEWGAAVGGGGVTSLVSMEPWHVIGASGEPAFQSGSNIGGVWQTVAFRKDPLGKVQLRGSAAGMTLGSAIFTLPVGYRPPKDVSYAVGTGSSLNVAGTLWVTAAGAVSLYVGNTGFAPLDVIEFDTETVAYMPTGPQGPKGDPGQSVESYAQNVAGQSGATTSCTTSAWTLLPLPTAANMTITSQAGVADFERMSDGSLRVQNAGFYDVSATIGSPSGINTGVLIGLRLCAAAAGVTPDANGAFSYATDGGSPSFPTISTARGTYLAVNQRVAVLGLQAGTTGNSMAVYGFSIMRAGAGPVGPKGDAGGTMGAAGLTLGQSPTTVSNAAGGYSPALKLGPVVNEDPVGFYTRNADSSISVAQAGWYTIDASVGGGATPPAGTEVGAIVFKNGVDIGNGAFVEAAYYGRVGVSTTLYLTPTDKVDVRTWSQAAITTWVCVLLSIARLGGPQGAKGDTGGNATVAMDGWHTVGAAGEPAFAGAWVNFGAGEQVAQFRKDPLGHVTLRGLVKSGTTAAIFTLPVGSRPPAGNPSWSCVANNGSSYGIAQIYINVATGEVRTTTSPFNIMLGGSAYVSLDSIEFDTDAVTQMPTGPQGPKGDIGGNATVPMEGWQTVNATGGAAPALASGWSIYGAGYEVQYRKDPLGKVQVRGMVQGSTAGTVFTLPVGYRPTRTMTSFAVNTSGSLTQPGYIQVASNGNVNVGSAGALNAVPLDVIEFDTDTVTQMPTGPQGPPGSTTPIQRVTTLPTTVYDGLEVYWQVDAGPPAVVWHMRWNNTTFRWECLGGNPISFRMDGEYNGYSAFASGTNITVNAAQNKALQWNINLPIDLWVEVTFSIGVVQKLDAAYHYAIFSTMVSGAVAIGTPHQILRTQHASVNTYEPYFLRSRLGLSANTNYAIYCQTAIQGGSWQFNQNSTYLSLVGSAWPR